MCYWYRVIKPFFGVNCSIFAILEVVKMKRIVSLSPLLMAVFCVSAVFAQVEVEKEQVPFADPDWGERQDMHKAFEYWLMWEKSGPEQDIVKAKAEGYKQFMAMHRPQSFLAMAQESTPAWRKIGGAQGGVVSGRPNGLGFSKLKNQVVYLATSGGGLYKSTDLGVNWVYVSEDFATNAIGDVAVDYTDDNIVYAGTGDMYVGNGESSTGDGMYKSTDAGLNWAKIASVNSETGIGPSVNQVILHPQIPTTIFVTGEDGVHRSTDGGATWKRVLKVSGTTSLVIDPNNGNNLWAGVGGAIRRSTDGGDTWPGGDVAKSISSKGTITMSLSIGSTGGLVLYAGIGSSDGQSARGLGKSLDSGNTWSLVWSGVNYTSQQAWYDNGCAANPKNPNYVLIGGLDMYKTTDGGANFKGSDGFANTPIADWRNSSTSPHYVHADIHVIEYSPYGQTYAWALTDGGVFRSADNGNTWTSCNRTLSTLLFMGGDADKDFTFALGGAQDNGINKASTDSNTKQFKTTQGGDGGRSFVSQTGDGTCYSTYVYADIKKSPNNGETWDRAGDNMIPSNSRLLVENGPNTSPFYIYYDVCETDPAYLAIAGNDNVYYSTDGLNTLDPITKSATITSTINTVHVPGADPYVVYAGAGSNVYVTKDASLGSSAVWTKSTDAPGTASDYVTDPGDAGKVWISVSGFGSKHFAYSEDYGNTWQYPGVNIPNVNCQTIARAPNGDLFLGHTLGVLRSIDGGKNWEPLRDGLPLSQVTKLRVRGSQTKNLLAVTYGHGMYAINISDLPRTVIHNGVADNTSSSGLHFDAVYPNPAIRGEKTSISFTTEASVPAQIIIYDELGKEIKTLANEHFDAGQHTIQCEMPETAGAYFMVLTSNGKSVTRKAVLQ
jgi:hypothetical protein